MTQVKEWSNQKLNRKLAELMGYRVNQENCYFYQLVNGAGEPVVGWYAQNPDDAWNMVPDYCTDPAASLEIQTAAITKDPEGWARNMISVKFGEKMTTDITSVGLSIAADMANATLREKAEAAYVALSQVSV